MAIRDCMRVWCVLIFSSGVWAQDPVASYAVRPADTTGVVGYEATMYCTVANLDRRQVFWNVFQSTTGKEFTLGPNANTHTSYQRFKFVGETSKGEYNLNVMNVSTSDAGSYKCIVFDPMKDPNSVMETTAILTVENTPTPPSTRIPDCNRSPLGNSLLKPGVYMKGDVLTLTCNSKGGVPRPRLSWVRISGSESMEDSYGGGYKLRSTTTVSGDVTTAIAKITLTSDDNQAFYKCIEEHPAISTGSQATCMTPFTGSESPMDVRFKPEVTLVPNVVIVHQLETRKVTLNCQVKANPLPTRSPVIILPVNKTASSYPGGTDVKTLVEVELSAEDVDKDFYCRADNELGLGEARLEIILGPFPTWLILVLIAAVAVVLLVFISVICCVLCVNRSDQDLGKGDVDGLRYSTKKSRPTSMRHEGEDDFLDDGMVPVGNFQGGQESNGFGDRKPIVNSDFETGETGPTYQNVNVAYQEDLVQPDPPSDAESMHEDAPDEVFNPDVVVEPEALSAPPPSDAELSRV